MQESTSARFTDATKLPTPSSALRHFRIRNALLHSQVFLMLNERWCLAPNTETYQTRKPNNGRICANLSVALPPHGFLFPLVRDVRLCATVK